MKKKWKLMLMLAALLIAAAAGLRIAYDDEINYRRGCALLEEGDYVSAREVFSATDHENSSVMLMECDYAEAKQLLGAGEYESAETAFLALKDYKDSPEKAVECRYNLALEAFGAGQLRQAYTSFCMAADFGDAAAKAEECLQGIYDGAKQCMYTGEFEQAADSFTWLGDYRDSEIQLKNCDERLEMEASFTGNKIVRDWNKVEEFEGGNLYLQPEGYIYVPDEVNEDTGWMVYFPGGSGDSDDDTEGEFNLSLPCVWMEHNMFSPNGIMIYLFENCFWNVRRNIDIVTGIMKQVALECDVWFHDLATTGSSNGCMSALIAVPVWYEQGITVDNVIAFDAGNEWYLPEIVQLTPEECEIIAEAGTKLYLFEQHDFTEYAMSLAPVVQLIDHGADVIAVECVNDGHNHIGPDGIRAGIFQFAINQQGYPEDDNFTFIKMHPGGEYERLWPLE